MPSTKSPRPAKSRSTVALHSLKLDRTHLADVGARCPTEALLKLLHTVLPKRAAHADFATYGFDAAWASAVTALGAELEAAAAAVGSAKSDTLPSGLALDQAIATAKDFRRRAATTVSLTTELAKRHGLIATGASTARLIRSLQALLPDVGSAYAVPHGGGAAMVKEGTAIVATLEKAQAAHQTALGKLSVPIRALQEKKGVLYEELRRLARAARAVVPAEAGLFAVSGHVRATRHRKKTGTAQTPATPSAPG